MDFSDGRTPYDILGISNGPQATDADIRKAYKTMALQKHPDKNKNNPNAAAEFAELEKAYRVLSDASARGALDDYLNAKAVRQQKQSQESDKRRKMREELERREKQATEGRSEEHIARVRLQQELERLRKKAEEEQRQSAMAQAQAAAAAAAASSGVNASTAEPNEDTKQQLRCSLKVSWDSNTRDYQPQELRQIFAAHGTVADVVVREAKKKSRSKATALVVMSTPQEADRAAQAVNGDVSDPLLVVPLLKVAPTLTPEADTLHPSPSPRASPGPTFPVAASTTQPAFPVSFPSHSPSAQPANGAATLFPVAGAGTSPQQQPSKPLFTVGAGGQQGPGTTASSFPAAAGNPGASYSTSGFSSFSFPGAGGAAGVGGMSGAEDAILQKMRRAAERERQLAAARAEDDAGQ